LSWVHWTAAHSIWSHVWSVLSTVVLSSLSSITLVVTSWSTTVSLIGVESRRHLLVLLHDVKELLEDLRDIWELGQVVQLERTSLLSLILLEVSLINSILNLDLSEFLDLIVVDDQGLTVIDGVVKGLLGHSGVVWLGEADESKVAFILSWLELDIFNGSELLEEFLELLIGPVGWEILDVEIASLLGSLVSEGLLHLLGFSIRLLKGMSDVELKFIAHVFVVEALNGLLGAFWSVLSILAFLIVVADETELTKGVLGKDERLDKTVLREKFSNLNIGHINWNVFHIDVVDESSHLASVLWLELDSDNIFVIFSFINGFLSGVISIKAYKAVSSGGVVLVHGDLE